MIKTMPQLAESYCHVFKETITNLHVKSLFKLTAHRKNCLRDVNYLWYEFRSLDYLKIFRCFRRILVLMILKVLGSSVLTEPENNGRIHKAKIINKLLPSMTQISKN